ncbi:MAG: VanZ family protein [Bacilli bacterium]
MVVKNIIDEMLPSIWPMVAFISIVAITLRCAYLFKGSRKFVLHKELLSLVFIIYILCLYYILMGQDGTSGVNLIPFKEMFRYSFGSYKFMKNIVGNILLFIPFGFFASYYLNNRKASLILIVSLIVSGLTEGLQYYTGRVFDIDDIILNVFGGFIGYLLYVGLMAIKGKLPKFMKSDAFINFMIILLVILIVLFSFDINIFNYL